MPRRAPVGLAEQLLRALPLQALYTLRSGRLLIEQLECNLFRWFVGLATDAPVWVPTTFTKNRERVPAYGHTAARPRRQGCSLNAEAR